MDNSLTTSHIPIAPTPWFSSCGAQPPPPLFYLIQYNFSQSYYLVLFSLPEVYFLHFWSCTFYMSPNIRIPCFIFDYLQLECNYSVKDWVIGCPTFANPSVYPTRKTSGIWTSTWLFSSPWTASSSDKTICVADHPNSEFWQRIGRPYVSKSGRCFVAVVDIEADRCAVCLAEPDAVQSEADRQAGCPMKEGRQQTISR